ncbi:hypothetical protein [Sphaerisporangium corydalis]|uniref:SWIM zinc finger family protein n=1 Tax=Sphaerisporangium corydalis TaxID=1441875 RepID=A0ABV9ES24_9ACTN|nr:hypothetical protein [Sphaerisporangium corydalis]
MLGTRLGELLQDTPEGVGEALGLVTGFDDALAHGFARLGEDRSAALAALAGALAATPLGGPVGEAVEKIRAGSVSDEHLVALAGGRAALFGAAHDALLDRLDTALGRSRPAWRPPAAEDGEVPGNLLGGCRVWLRELAITGWRGVDHDLVTASDQTLEALLSAPRLRGLAVLLDGLAAELRASCPVGTMERLPVRRWADLWTRGLLLSQAGAWDGGAEPVSGRLLILGTEVHEHSTVVRAQVHAILEPAGGAPPRLVRASVAAAKVDTITGPAVWRLLGGYPVLLGALAGHRTLEITDMPLLAGGDLVWQEERAVAGEPADPFATARILLGRASPAAVPPLDRHPVRISEPVLVEGYTTGGGAFDLGGAAIDVDVDRLPSCGPLTPEMVAASSSCLGLLRWDGGRWLLRPMAVLTTVKRKPVAAHNGDWALGPTDPKAAKAEARAGDGVAVLRERAGRLLRK